MRICIGFRTFPDETTASLGLSCATATNAIRIFALATPDLETRADFLCALAHARDAPVNGPRSRFECAGIDAPAIVPHAHAKIIVGVNDLKFDRICTGMLKRVEQRFASDAIGLILHSP